MDTKLQLAITKLLEQEDLQRLKSSSDALTERYRAGLSIQSEEMLAYLTVRLPATYAALSSVISQISPGSILDVGAGPGTSWWAARTTWNTVLKVTAIEKEAKFIELGQQLGSEVNWVHADAHLLENFEPHDWVFFSYSLGEILDNGGVLYKGWQAAEKGIVIVEPGTPKGYARVLHARNALIAKGGSVLAPCTHSNACPIESHDWCHFCVRLERSSLHKLTKQASLPYEDEKFSYVVVTKAINEHNSARITRHPVHRPGHVILSLCSEEGLKKVTIARSQKERYKKARRAHWGEQF